MEKKVYSQGEIPNGQISVTELANYLGLTRQAVLWQIKNGKLPEGVQSVKVGHNYVLTVKK